MALEIAHQGTIELEVQKLKFVPASREVVQDILPNTDGHYSRGADKAAFEPLPSGNPVSICPLQGWYAAGSNVGPSIAKALEGVDPLAKYSLSAENLPVTVSLIDQCLANQARMKMDLVKTVEIAFFYI